MAAGCPSFLTSLPTTKRVWCLCRHPSGFPAATTTTGHGTCPSSAAFLLLLLLVPTVASAAPVPPTPAERAQYALRIVEAASPLEGRIELRPYEGAEWGMVCSNVFKTNDHGANAVCRSLGFAGTNASSFVSFGPAPNNMPIWLDGVTCAADTPYFQNCTSKPLSDHSCVYGDAAGVRCVPPTSAWEFRLVNSTADLPTRGLVLFRPAPVVPWGTVSADNYEAPADPPLHMRRALCAAMGHNVAFPIVAPALRFGSADASAPTYLHSPPNACGGHTVKVNYVDVVQPVIADYARCSMTGPFGQKKWDASRQLQLYCDEREVHALYQVRLVNGYANHSGQVQYRPDDASPWLFLSNRSLLLGSGFAAVGDASLHNQAALNAICHSAGFADATQAAFRFFGAFAVAAAAGEALQRTAQVERIACPMDGAATLRDCDMARANFKTPGATPGGVDCYPERLQGSPWEFALANTSVGGKASLGVVRMRFGAESSDGGGDGDGRGGATPWGFVSANETNNFGLWDAVCAALGYANTSTRIVRDLTRWNGGDPSWALNTSTAFMPSYLSNVSCPPRRYTAANVSYGAMTLRTDCSHAPLASSPHPPSSALVIDCDTGANVGAPEHWEVRVNGSLGLVEFRPDGRLPLSAPNGRWGIVCAADANALYALCAAAGYGDSRLVERVVATVPAGAPPPPSFLHGLRCPEGSRSLAECSFEHFEGESCPVGMAAAADCYAVPNDPSLWQFRVAGTGSDPSQGLGRLEVLLAPWARQWGTVCSSGWGEAERLAACRSLGLDPAGRTMASRAVTASHFGTDMGPYVLNGVECKGAAARFLPNCTVKLFSPTSVTCGSALRVALHCWPPAPPPQGFEFRGVLANPAVSSTIIRIEARAANSSDEWIGVYQNAGTAAIQNLLAACRTAGFLDVLRAERTGGPAFPGPATQRAITSMKQCPENARFLSECTTYDEQYMNYDYIVGTYNFIVECRPIYSDPPQWQFRLRGGPDASGGLLELLPLSYAPWALVCDGTKTLATDEAHRTRACLSAGFNYTAALEQPLAPSEFVLPPRVGDLEWYGAILSASFWLKVSFCAPTAAYLQNCTNEFRPGSTSRDCQMPLQCDFTRLNLDAFEYRLVPLNAELPAVGRVEMRPGSWAPWGVIAEQSRANVAIARAACGSLGYANPFAVYGPAMNAAKGNARYPIYVQGYSCPPNASSLRECQFDASLFNITSQPAANNNAMRDLTVECDYFPPSDRRQWEFRLERAPGVDKPHFGKVMFRPAPSAAWGTISGGSTMNDLACPAICRSLGYTEENGHRDPLSAQCSFRRAEDKYPLNNSGRVWMGRLACPGPMRLLQDCTDFDWRPLDSYGGPPHSTDIWIDCYPVIQARIVGGPSPWRGRIEVKYNNWTGAWGTLCNDEFATNHFSWLAACRSAGFTNATFARFEEFGPHSDTNFPIALDDVYCSEGERFLSDCASARPGVHDCDHSEDSGVNCYAEPDNRTLWLYRFAGVGSTDVRGRIEHLPADGAQWGMICSLNFNHSYAVWMVACRTLGVVTTRAVPTTRFGPGPGPIYLDNVACPPNASHLNDCGSYPLGSYGCSPAQSMGLDCDPPPEDPSAWEFRLDSTTLRLRGEEEEGRIIGASLIGGAVVATAGTLMARFSPSEPWGTVCNNNPATLGSPALFAALVCRTLGLFNASHPPVLHRTGAAVRAPQWYATVLSNASCDLRPPPSGAASLRQCAFNPMYDHSCDHSMDVHVNCRPPAVEAQPRTMTESPTVTSSLAHASNSASAIPILSRTESNRPQPLSSSASAIVGTATASTEISTSGAAVASTSMYMFSSLSVTVEAITTNVTTAEDLCTDPTTEEPTAPEATLTNVTAQQGTNVTTLPTVDTEPPSNSLTEELASSAEDLTTANITTVRSTTATDEHDANTSEKTATLRTTTEAGATAVPTGTSASPSRVTRSVRCRFLLAVVFDTFPLLDTDVQSRSVTVNISLPQRGPQSPFRFVKPLDTSNNGSLAFAEATAGGDVHPLSSDDPLLDWPPFPSAPFLIPYPIVGITAAYAAVGTAEPRGYKATFGLNGQAAVDAGWWREEAAEAESSAPKPLKNSSDAQRELGAKHGGRVFCEAIAHTTVRCVVPQNAAYALYSRDLLALEALPALVDKWVTPRCVHAEPDGPEPSHANATTAASGHTSGALAPGEHAYYYSSLGNTASGAVRHLFVVEPAEPSELAAAVDAIGAVAGSVSVLAALVGGLSMMDAQLMIMLAQSECMGDIDHRGTSLLRYFISPVTAEGPAAEAFFNLALIVGFAGLQRLLARHFEASRRIKEIDSWAAVRFPNYSFIVAQLFFVGLCDGSLSMLSGAAPVAGGDGEEAVSYVLGVLGLLACLCVIAAVSFFSFSVVTGGKFIQYTQFLSRPWYARWLYPLGFWEGPARRLAHGHMLSAYREGRRIRLFSAAGFASAFITALIMKIGAIPCAIRFCLVGIVYLALALLYVVLWPSRHPANSAFAATGQALLALLAFIAAAQVVSPTVEMMNAKLALVLLQILLVIVRSCFSISLRVLEQTRWRKFREQNTDGFADDEELVSRKSQTEAALLMMALEDLEGGEGMGRPSPSKSKHSPSQDRRVSSVPPFTSYPSNADDTNGGGGSAGGYCAPLADLTAFDDGDVGGNVPAIPQSRPRALSLSLSISDGDSPHATLEVDFGIDLSSDRLLSSSGRQSNGGAGGGSSSQPNSLPQSANTFSTEASGGHQGGSSTDEMGSGEVSGLGSGSSLAFSSSDDSSVDPIL